MLVHPSLRGRLYICYMWKVAVVRNVALLVLLLHCVDGLSQGIVEVSERVMFYNVENLFDINDDTLIDDEEFLPKGVRRWTSNRYYRKINNIYKVIAAAGGWSPPAIVGFAEVENRKVLEDLTSWTGLSKAGYEIVHEESPDRRGIDVGFIYRKDVVSVINYSCFIPDGVQKSEYTSRYVVYAACTMLSDTIHIFVNHWPSRRGGTLVGQEGRLRLASTINRKVDSLSIVHGEEVKVIVMGDLNSPPDDPSVLMMTGKRGVGLIDMSNVSMNQGTYKYQGKWEVIDHFLVSEGLLDTADGVYTTPADFTIFSQPFLLVDDSNYTGQRPLSTWWGYRHSGGFSDHLPILLDLKRRGE